MSRLQKVYIFNLATPSYTDKAESNKIKITINEKWVK